MTAMATVVGKAGNERLLEAAVRWLPEEPWPGIDRYDVFACGGIETARACVDVVELRPKWPWNVWDGDQQFKQTCATYGLPSPLKNAALTASAGKLLLPLILPGTVVFHDDDALFFRDPAPLIARVPVCSTAYLTRLHFEEGSRWEQYLPAFSRLRGEEVTRELHNEVVCDAAIWAVNPVRPTYVAALQQFFREPRIISSQHRRVRAGRKAEIFWADQWFLTHYFRPDLFLRGEGLRVVFMHEALDPLPLGLLRNGERPLAMHYYADTAKHYYAQRLIREALRRDLEVAV